MNTLLISYDLGLPETISDYHILIEYIKSYSYWAKPLQSVWLIRTNKSTAQVRDEIKLRIDNNDKVLVIDITNKPWASFNISKEVTGWMQLP